MVSRTWKSRRWVTVTSQVVIATFLCTCSPFGPSGPAVKGKPALNALDYGTLTFFHPGFRPGPGIITSQANDQGEVLVFSERRSSPFGVPIDELRETALGQVVDTSGFFERETFGALEKEHDQTTGYTFHGARWFSPQIGTWLSADPLYAVNPEKSLASPIENNLYVYASNNPVMYVDPTGMYDELVHGALTYHLALAAGFSKNQASVIALNCARVDHDPLTKPVDVGNIINRQTKEWHFADQSKTLQKVNRAIEAGNLTELGRLMHVLQDVGFKDAPGPHARGVKLPWLTSHGIYVPEKTYSEGYLISSPISAFTDVPALNPELNKRQLMQIYGVLRNAAGKMSNINTLPDDVGAEQLVNQAMSMMDMSDVGQLLLMKGVDNLGRSAGSYGDILLKNTQNGGAYTSGVTWGAPDITYESLYKEGMKLTEPP